MAAAATAVGGRTSLQEISVRLGKEVTSIFVETGE